MLADAIRDILIIILELYLVVIIIRVVLSWLVAFDIVSRRNAIVDTFWRFTGALTEPVARPLRRIIPPIGGVDLSLMVIAFAIILLIRLLPVLL